jgi:hypothetical protein
LKLTLVMLDLTRSAVCRGRRVAVGVIQGYLGNLHSGGCLVSVSSRYNQPANKTNLVATPNQQSSDRRKYDTDDEEHGEHGLGSENGLPCLEALLLEGSVCGQTSGVSPP